jgi:hypothetical protein
MPANRSRTQRWRECLQQIYERNGGLEFTLAGPTRSGVENNTYVPDLMWRVRVAGISETEILIEPPAAAGTTIRIEPGSTIIAVMSVGQNRWMFRSTIVSSADSPWRGADRGMLRVQMPEQVERCQRREFLRVSTAELHLPQVDCWPLFNPLEVASAEAANRAVFLATPRNQTPAPNSPNDLQLPDVGPIFHGSLMNVGGGGVGLLFRKDEASAAERARHIWMRVNLTPVLAAPIAVAARIVHKHLDSEQNLICGASFEFASGHGHREFVAEQMSRYVLKVMPDSRAA